MERKKCICLSRVSTGIQDLDQQTEKLIEAAHYQKYNDNDIITIEDKESAVCKNEEERNGLNKLKEYVETGEVELVIVYELSRIARRADVLYSIRDFLISHKVQLQVMNPSFKLLKDDGTIDENSNILMGIFASLSENEGYLRKARFKRGKAKKSAEGKFINGTALFGYKVVNYQVIVDEDYREEIQDIFNDYVYNNKTAKDIAIDLVNRGKHKFASLNAGVQFVYNILHNCSYAGIPSSERAFKFKPKAYDYTYPAIVSKETFEKALSTFTKRQKYNKVHTKNEYLLRGLVYRKDMVPFNVFSSHNTYACCSYDLEKNDRIEISVKTLDDFVWNLVVNRKIYRPASFKENSINAVQIKLSDLDCQIVNAKAAIADREDKIKRIEYRVIQGKLNENDADEFEAPIRKEIEDLNKNLDSLCVDRERLNEKISKLSNSNYEVTIESLSDLSFDEKYKMVREEVNSIIITNKQGSNITVGIAFDECDDVELYIINRYNKKIRRLDYY